MTDFFIKPIPLPVARPAGDIYHGIALEDARKPVGELFDIWSYPTSGESTKPLSELLIESSGKLTILMVLVTVAYVVYRFNRWKRTGL